MRSAKKILLFGAQPKLLFDAPLKSNLLLTRGVGAATFTRASAATVTDFEGLIKNVNSGEARFSGTRRVANILTNSEDFSISPWSVGATANVTNKTTLNLPNVGDSLYSLVSVGTSVGGAWTTSIVLSGSGTLHLLMQTNNGVAENDSIAITLSSTPTRYSFSRTYLNSGHTSCWFYIKRDTGDTATSVLVGNVQIENVTGQSNKNPSEYVSVGVLSSPYHGANVDGVKYFTYENGNTVSSNVVTEAQGVAIPESTLLGYLAEGNRINLLLQSETVATQNITVTAQAYTLSSWGTGSITLSGTGSGTLNGTGANDRVSLTFTPTAGTLTLTVTGSCTKGQTEAGTFASSYIPTTTASVTRAADALSYPVLNNQFDLAGSIYLEVSATSWGNVAGNYLGDGTNYIAGSLTNNSGIKSFDGTNTVNGPTGTPAGTMKLAVAWGKGKITIAANGVLSIGTYDGAFSLASLKIGNGFYGNIKNVKIWNKALRDAKLKELTR